MLITGSSAAYYHNLVDSFPKDLDTFYKDAVETSGEDLSHYT